MDTSSTSRVRRSARRSTKPAHRKPASIRYLAVEGDPRGGFGDRGQDEPDSSTALPSGHELWDAQVLGSYPTVEEAIAECRRVNEVMITTNMFRQSWAMVVVDPNGQKGGVNR
jgi:hypothetical protein